MDKSKLSTRPDLTYEEIISADKSGAPDFLRHADKIEAKLEPVSVERYWSRDFFEKENKYLWTRTWQMACMIQDIPKIGDCFLYEISDKSLIITQTENGVKAFFNSCLHRGRKLITGHCNKTKFVCPFHAIAWSNTGELVNNPIAWDMPQWNSENSQLPQAKVAVWGGFVFINMDQDAPEFGDWAAPMIKHFKPYDWDNRYCEFWFEKHVRANWKTTAEPFMESHHSQTTHPQLLPSIADINSQYDSLNNYISRHISAGATASPSLDPPLTDIEQLALMQKRGDSRTDGVDIDSLPADFRTRSLLADHTRTRLTAETGYDHSDAKDAEVLDYLLYGVFPNMAFWAGYGPKLVYRWRPEPGNPEGSIMDVMLMAPLPKGAKRPPRAQKTVLGYDDRFSDQNPGSSSLKMVFDQDFGNIPHVQTGMKSSAEGVVHFSNYTEARIRYMHQMIDNFIATGERGEAIPKP
ncbi:aromatic ring-hydroxylating oxygenase subunit alpha [Litorimonas sp.]|uniref:aromatic ring-hydroxylating oxygenase subunit alpha n=1 Tax=Litorimonas sp. TaxID=1892381 RepID=UPI003A859D13